MTDIQFDRSCRWILWLGIALIVAAALTMVWISVNFLAWSCDQKWPAPRDPHFDLRTGCTILHQGERLPAYAMARRWT